jgi:hypothetical protein
VIFFDLCDWDDEGTGTGLEIEKATTPAPPSLGGEILRV